MADSNIDIAIRAKNQASGPIREVKADLTGLEKAGGGLDFGSALAGGALAFGLAAVADNAMQAGAAIFDMARQAAGVEALRASFDQLAASAGQSGGKMLDAMRAASSGMIADADLMLSANKAMMLGVADSAEEMANLLEVAAVRGKAMGLSTGQAFSDLVTGIGRMSPLILDNLGIVTGGEAVFDAYAASLGRTAESLSDVEKKQALLNKVIAETDTSALPAANSFERMDAAIQNSRVALGEMFGPAMAKVAEGIASGLTQMADAATTDAIESAQGRLQTFGLEITRLAQEAGGLSALSDLANLDGDTTRFAELQTQLANVTTQLDVFVNNYNKAATATGAPLIDPEQARQGTIAFMSAADAAEYLARGARQASNETDKAAAAATLAKYSVDALAQAMVGANATAQAMAGGLSLVQAQAGATAGIIYNLTSAMAGLNAVSNANLSKPDALDLVIPQINTIGGGLVDDLGLDGAIAKTEELKIQNRELYEQLKATGKYTEDEIYMALSANVSQTQKWAGALGNVGSAVASVSKEYTDLQSKVSGVLSGALDAGVGVTAEDLLPREDAINENARRLAAIAQEGIANQPWLEEFKREAPGAWADIMLQVAAGVDAKTAAARIFRDFEDGMRPDLIDKDAAKERVKRMILGDQSMAALAEEIAAELAAEMGIPLQDAMAAAGASLGVKTGAAGDAAKEASGASASVTLLPDTTALAGVVYPEMPAISVPLTPTVDIEAMNHSGAMAGTQWGLGFVSNADGTIIAASIIGKMAGQLPRFRDSGASAGTQWGAGFMTTVEGSIAQPLIGLLATLVTPAVMAAIQAGNSQTTPP